MVYSKKKKNEGNVEYLRLTKVYKMHLIKCLDEMDFLGSGLRRSHRESAYKTYYFHECARNGLFTVKRHTTRTKPCAKHATRFLPPLVWEWTGTVECLSKSQGKLHLGGHRLTPPFVDDLARMTILKNHPCTRFKNTYDLGLTHKLRHA